MTHPLLLRHCLVAALLGLAVPVALAVSDDTCLGCHSSADALSDAGARAPKLVVDAKSLSGSVHDGFSCTQCHAELSSDDAPIPHPAKLAPVDCASCHADVAETLKKTSIHAARIAPVEGAKSPCAACHGNHQIRSAKDPDSRTNPHHLPDTCGTCHTAKQGGASIVNDWKNSVHGRAALDWEIADAPTCVACHSAHEIRSTSDPDDPLNRRNRMNVCARCHPSELKVILRGAHGKAWQAGNMAAPVCTDCHGSHDIERINERASRVYAGQVSATCGKCHGDPDLTIRFGLRPDRVTTYENSYHGKGSRWQSSNVANCASCHRYHDVRAATDPASPVAPHNLQATCGRPDCHPAASEQFAQLPVHAGASQRGAALLRFVRISYVLIITLTLAFMGLHQVLDLRAAFRTRRRQKAGHAAHADEAADPVTPPRMEPLSTLMERDGKWVVQRWGARMVAQHLSLAVTFLTLCVTGFALELPAAWASKFGSAGPGMFNLRSILHRVAAVLMIATALYHMGWLLWSRRGRRELIEMLPQPIDDLKYMIASFQYFLGFREHAPAGRRYTYREKMEYWALVWGTFVMVVTGVVLWSAPHWHWLVVEVSRIVHSYEAILAFAAIVIWHMFSVQWRPGIGKTHPTWVDGTITVPLMRHEHEAEYQEMVAWYGIDPERDATRHGSGRPNGEGR